MAKIKQFFNELTEGSKMFGELISEVVNLVLLSFVYFIGVGLTSIFAKISGKRFIDDKTTKESYWEELNLTTQPLKEYYRQF
ncbi:hypothetical protein K0A97_01950 [Patescibacteria group bacterium]|nr:hypothetical protein [Patescibacteria group bacterium]